MYPTNIYIQVTFYRTLFFSKFTFKMLLFFMNRSNMVQQATLFRKTMVTKFMFFHSFCKRKNSSRDTIKDNLSRKEKKIPKITAQTYHLQIKMHKLNKHIFQYKKIFCKFKKQNLKPSSCQPQGPSVNWIMLSFIHLIIQGLFKQFPSI